ncbi:MAG: cyclopropane-fatty-acyl-phospholipid synthase family protein [Deltaproteobacteria bacterium]|nr:cyclopropane-fatty-acyl-phospholipid synthase family protein [Deltaproteobacteria bacterium]
MNTYELSTPDTWLRRLIAPRVDHPLIVPIVAPGLVGRAARHLAVNALRSRWPALGPRLEMTLPNGEILELGGHGDPARVRVHDDRMFVRLLTRGEMGAGESYVAGEWDADDLTLVVRRFLRATGARGFESPLTVLGRLPALVRHRRANNSRAGSERNIGAHYDLGNSFYRLFLDDSLAYSCALWPRADMTLAEAQEAKFERLAELLDLRPGQRVLEIGGGWGGLAMYLARTRGVHVTAVTVSKAQLAEAQARIATAGLSDRVRFEFRDYRDLGPETYDKVVSVEMLEAVGHEYLPTYFAAVARALVPGGRAAIQTITMPDDRYEGYRQSVDWMQTYIFPGSLIPSLGAIRGALAGTGLTLTRADDIGPDYAPTLAAWRDNFIARMPEVKALGYDTPFIRTWLLYLAFSEAAFAERTLGDHHLVFDRA